MRMFNIDDVPPVVETDESLSKDWTYEELARRNSIVRLVDESVVVLRYSGGRIRMEGQRRGHFRQWHTADDENNIAEIVDLQPTDMMVNILSWEPEFQNTRFEIRRDEDGSPERVDIPIRRRMEDESITTKEVTFRVEGSSAVLDKIEDGVRSEHDIITILHAEEIVVQLPFIQGVRGLKDIVDDISYALSKIETDWITAE